MSSRPIRYRRARRTDFDAVGSILAANGLPAPTPQRADLHRFRRLVSDLGADLYVAEIDARVVGLVHVTYSRHLSGQRGRLALLVVAPEAQSRRVGRGLAALAAQRARRRGCTALRAGATSPTSPAARFLVHIGYRTIGEELEFTLADLAD